MSHTGSAVHPRRFWVRLALVVAVSLAVLVSIAGYVALRRFRLPAPTGTYAVGTCILNMTDISRREVSSPDPTAKRQLVVQLWYPAADSSQPFADYKRWRETAARNVYETFLRTNSHSEAPVELNGAPFPVLLFGHRWDGDRTQDTALAEDLASHGYVVVSVDHPYNSDRVLLPDGSVIRNSLNIEGPRGDAASAAEQIAFWNQQLEVWAADEMFVLDQLAAANLSTASRFHARLDTERAGAFGHSFGGAAALRLCGLDPRIKAAANLDGWSFAALDHRTAAQDVMIVYEAAGLQQSREALDPRQPDTKQHELDRADTLAVLFSLQRFGGLEFYVAGTQHLDFTDQPLLPPLRRSSTGPIAPQRIDNIDRTLVLAFFDQALRGQQSAWLDHPQGQFPEVSGGRIAPNTY